ncbi:hypothetical protein [Bdellovibrio sp. HCB2-146]|uniref:hypothetical protein n=1 Tax=Bdellovibrio sp. HCB2-146 TaxID=3394362 RepID=UPI0039BC2C25
MKAFVTVLMTGLLLIQTAHAGVVIRVNSLSAEGQQIITALKLSPNNSYRCVAKSDGKDFTESTSYLSSFISTLENFGGYSIAQYDGPTPLFEALVRNSDYVMQMSLYTNASATEVVQIIKKDFRKTQVNKGTLAKPNLGYEDRLYRTTTCTKIVSK